MDKNKLETVKRIAKFELEKLADETLRPNQGFKMRFHGPVMQSLINVIGYCDDELSKLDKEERPTLKRKPIPKEDK